MFASSVVNALWMWNIAKGPHIHFFPPFVCGMVEKNLRAFLRLLFIFISCVCFFSLYVHLFVRLFFLVIFPFGFWIALVCVRFCKLCSAIFPNECVCGFG